MVKSLFRTSLCCILFIFSAYLTVEGKNPQKKSAKNNTATQTKEVADLSQLMADKVTVKKQVEAMDSLMIANLLEEENLLYPADDLYTIWDNRYVNPYEKEKVAVPDSFAINVSSFSMPCDNNRITSKYGPRRRRMHRGTDIKVQTGDTIRAAFDGKVRIKYYERRGYGYYLVLRHPNGLETVYGHLSKFLVDLNHEVKSGQPIALGGNTGRSSGSHLHFEMRFLGIAINPADIVDFDNLVAHKDIYTFNKKISGGISSKYTTGGIVYHRIKSGDTLGAIARKYGISLSKLCKLNKIRSTTKLRVGSSLRCS